MQKKQILSLVLGSLAFFVQPLSAQITGVVFRDYNGNGVLDGYATAPAAGEVGAMGVTVNAYNASNTLTGTTTTDAAGAYSLPVSAGSYRVEFVNLLAGDYAAPMGSSSNSSTQFVTAPASTVNFGILYPEDYKDAGETPWLAAPIFVKYSGHAHGDPNPSWGGGFMSTKSLAIWDYNFSGIADNWGIGGGGPMFSEKSNIYQIGNIFGLAYERKTGFMYAGAMFGRHLRLINSGSDNGLTNIFKIDRNAGENGSVFVNLKDLGVPTTAVAPSNTDRGLVYPYGLDSLGYSRIGKWGLGGLEISDDGTELWTIALDDANNYLVKIIIDADNNNSTAPSSADVSYYPISWSCSGGQDRPFGLKYYRGKLYIGLVCDASISQNTTDLDAYVLEFDPSTTAFNSVFTANLDYAKGAALTNDNCGNYPGFYPWVNNYNYPPQPTCTFTPPSAVYPQPFIADIEFDTDGAMLIGIGDRWGTQTGEHPTTGGSFNQCASTGGDLLRAYKAPASSVYTLESNGTVGSAAGTLTGSGAGNLQGPGGGEFYFDGGSSPHQERYHGTLAVLEGSGTTIAAYLNPVGLYAGGIVKANNTNGTISGGYEIYGSGWNNAAAKGLGMGDVELLVSGQAPIEIGNRVWEDINENGVQDAGENGISGISVALQTSGGTPIATATTDANGNYVFSSAGSGSAGGATYGVNIQPNTAYRLVFPTSTTISGNSAVLTSANATGTNVSDLNDSDAAVTGIVTFTTGIKGANNHSFDAGYSAPTQCLGNYVWLDADKDGIQDASEAGVSGVTVTLYDGTTVIGTIKTDAFGAYEFCGIPVSAAYTVKFSLPADYVFTMTGAGVPSTDSDPDPSTGVTSVFSVTSGQIRTDIDAGIYFQPKTIACLGDYVWVDDNQNGTQDATEAGVEGIVVNLLDNGGNVLSSTVTNSAGYYQFCDLTPDVYSVNFVLPVGYQFTAANVGSDNSDSDASTTLGAGFGNTATVSLLPGDFNRTLDAGIYPTTTTTASVGDLVWNDLNQNGIQDAGEPGVKNVTVQLFDAGNTLINTLQTDAFGNYLFTNVAPGCYYVVFNAPAGYTYSTAAQGGNIYLDSDPTIIAGTQGTTPNFCVVNGDRLVNIDAGIYQSSPAGTARLGNYVWYDVDQDGLQDASETGVPGVTVVLLDNTSSEIARTTTDRDGLYQFTNLAAGTYSVAFSNLPSGYTFTSTTQGTATGSDANRATGETQQVTLAVGDSHQDLDAGIIITDGNSGKASLGNYVWNDLNSNGQQDAGEPGVGNVFVELLDESSVQIATVYTDALGYYIFNGLDAGRYYVRFNAPSGYNFTTQNSGADATDSDANTGTGVTGQYILAIGETNLTVDAGLVSTSGNTASLGNYVWIDSNSDGIQNETNTGIGGICVSLENAGGTVLVTTTTDNTGFYLFPNLAAGSYRVKFGCLPAGYTFTTKNAGGSTTANDSDAGTEGSSDLVTLLAGEQNLTVDAGIRSTTVAAVGNYVWLDANQDGQQGVGESPVAGVTATLYNAGTNAVIASAITDSRGEYYFYNVDASLTYYVIFSNIPDGTKFTTQNSGADASDSDANTSGRSDNFTVAAGGTNFTIDAGLITPCASSLSGYTWVDDNTDGQQAANERPVSGITVTLSQGGVAILKSITDAKGWYHFNGVPAGTYDVTFGTIALGSTFTVQNSGSDATDSDSDGAGNAGSVVLSCAALRGPDAGFTPTGVLPVNVLSFTGKLQGEDGILHWVTTAEINLSGFEISRSFDGQLFERIASVAAKGNATNTTSYEMTDKNVAFSGANKVYYRLTGKDLDGTESSQNLVELNLKGNKAMFAELYPNPVTTTLFLSYQVEATTQVEVVNMLGEVVYTNALASTVGVSTLEINTQNWSNGIYFVRLSNKSSVKTMKVVK